jgi:hypothetical protein
MEDAWRVFNEIRLCDVSWNAMIFGYVKCAGKDKRLYNCLEKSKGKAWSQAL